jgi:hypothetical protein
MIEQRNEQNLEGDRQEIVEPVPVLVSNHSSYTLPLSNSDGIYYPNAQSRRRLEYVVTGNVRRKHEVENRKSASITTGTN